MKSFFYIDNLEKNQKNKFVQFGFTVKSPEEILEISVDNIDGLVILCEININKEGSKTIINIVGRKELKSKNISVPSDLSSSAFFIVAALINKNSKILLKNINITFTFLNLVNEKNMKFSLIG